MATKLMGSYFQLNKKYIVNSITLSKLFIANNYHDVYNSMEYIKNYLS